MSNTSPNSPNLLESLVSCCVGVGPNGKNIDQFHLGHSPRGHGIWRDLRKGGEPSLIKAFKGNIAIKRLSGPPGSLKSIGKT